jgi:hypothetical protein
MNKLYTNRKDILKRVKKQKNRKVEGDQRDEILLTLMMMIPPTLSHHHTVLKERERVLTSYETV